MHFHITISMAASNDPNYVPTYDCTECEGCPICAPSGSPELVRADNSIIADDIKSLVCDALDDAIHAAWNGWEKACLFQDEKLQDYYMKLQVEISKFKISLRNIKKKD